MRIFPVLLLGFLLFIFPSSYGQEQAGFDEWARVAMDNKDWKAAIKTYQIGLKQFPQSGLLKRNMEYCKSMLK